MANPTNSTSNATPRKLPQQVMDAHHHFLDTTTSPDGTATNEFQTFLGSLVPDETYLPEQYDKDVVQPLQEQGVTVAGSVHVECMPDDGVQEVAWVHAMANDGTVKAIVGSCDLTSPSVDEHLAQLKAASPRVRGVRWILDCVGPFAPNTATHVATTRHDGYDYLRGSHGQGTYDGHVVPAFEHGFACLAQHQLSFDLQCAPVQLKEAAALCQRHPEVPVVIDHLGKPRTLLGPDNNHDSTTTTPNPHELEQWRQGMKAMAALPHVYVKLSMLGYAVPGWTKTPERTALVQSLVRETVDLFTPQRCMVAWNWWKNGAVSDSDGLSDVGPSAPELLDYLVSFFDGYYTEEEQERLFYGTAKEFYRI